MSKISKTGLFAAVAAAFAAVVIGGGVASAAAVPEGQTVTVTPSTGLSDGATVEVAAAGYTADEPVLISECAMGATGPVCAGADAEPVTTDAAGAVSESFVVHQVIATPTGDVDCGVVAGGCFVGVANDSFTESAFSPITFE